MTDPHPCSNLAVCDHPLHVGDEESFVDVVVALQPLPHRLHVHRELDVVVVIRHNLNSAYSFIDVISTISYSVPFSFENLVSTF